MEYKKYRKLVNIIKKQTDRYRELIVANGETEEERDKIGQEIKEYKLLSIK